MTESLRRQFCLKTKRVFFSTFFLFFGESLDFFFLDDKIALIREDIDFVWSRVSIKGDFQD